MKKTVFDIPKMDCPSEERTIRLAFDGLKSVKNLSFDLAHRRLEVLHENSADEVLAALLPLGFGAKISETHEASEVDQARLGVPANDFEERAALQKVFALNAIMFFVEIVMGLYAQSAGLVADSLDMFADAAVFALSLYAVGKSISLKKKAARISGYFQLTLALGTLFEVVRRLIYGSEPEGNIMMIIAAIALVANALSMWILQKHRNGEVHMQASWIFLTNDVIANVGVIVAGVLVMVTGSFIPDLAIGTIIASIVLWGSIRILKSSRP